MESRNEGTQCFIYTQNHMTLRMDLPMRLQSMHEIQPVLIEYDLWIGVRVWVLHVVYWLR